VKKEEEEEERVFFCLPSFLSLSLLASLFAHPRLERTCVFTTTTMAFYRDCPSETKDTKIYGTEKETRNC